VRRIRRLLLITFLESFATICLERGIYFFTSARLAFTKAQNLALAVAFGAAYFAMAFASHPIAARLGERRLLRGAILGLLAIQLALAGWMQLAAGRVSGLGDLAVVFVATTLVGALTGIKWPVIESYVSAGATPNETFGIVGRFSFAWAGAVPLSLALAGPLIALHPSALFLVPAGLNGAGLVLTAALADRPLHLPHDHPARPDPARMARMRSLLAAGRLQLLASYALMWVLAAVVPNLLASRFGLAVVAATAVASLQELARVKAFVILSALRGFCDRVGVLLAANVLLPAGFALVLFANSLPVLIAGEILFGLAAGIIYYASLYHALVIKNAAVEAGGAHEGLIGLGFAIGPIAGLIGLYLPYVDSMQGVTIGVAPVVLVCLVLAGVLLCRTGRDPSA
jgi:MFS family permease